MWFGDGVERPSDVSLIQAGKEGRKGQQGRLLRACFACPLRLQNSNRGREPRGAGGSALGERVSGEQRGHLLLLGAAVEAVAAYSKNTAWLDCVGR